MAATENTTPTNLSQELTAALEELKIEQATRRLNQVAKASVTCRHDLALLLPIMAARFDTVH